MEDVIHQALEVARRVEEPERARDPFVLAHRVSHSLFSAGRRLLGCAAGETHPAGRVLKTFVLLCARNEVRNRWCRVTVT